METYVVPVNYEYSKRKNGDESLNRIIKHIRKVLPKLDEDELRSLLKG